MSGSLFSICKVYPTKANPDPLQKVDSGDVGDGILWLSIDSGERLISCDADGKSDPQVLVTFEGMEWMSVTVFNTLHPEWGDEFRIPVMHAPATHNDDMPITFLVTDYDLMSANDFMGLGFLELGETIRYV